jgi:predicted nucleotidyltransferase
VALDQLIRERRDEIRAVAARHGVTSIRVFGSIARGESRPDSDLDLLIETGPKVSSWFPGGLIADLEATARSAAKGEGSQPASGGSESGQYSGRLWVTRPRPGVDRMASAWLIRRFIDAKARFGFITDVKTAGDALPFDMFGAGFGHEGDRCTFETLAARFGIRDAAVARIAEIVHDLDLKDGKFGAPEAATLGIAIEGLQLSSMDHVFHDSSLSINPLPFKNMKDTYAMINGRGYPDTVNTAPLPPPVEKSDYLGPTAESSQPIHALITATKGQRVLLRLSNLSVTAYYTVTAQGLPMKVVGAGARQLRGPDGKNLYYDTASVTLGGGESAEVLIDTSQVVPGTYFLYTTNLNYLSNFDQDNGGMMTEIVIAP